jgi:hypothetical protein
MTTILRGLSFTCADVLDVLEDRTRKPISDDCPIHGKKPSN